MPDDNAISWMWPDSCAMLARAERLQCQFFHIGSPQELLPVGEPRPSTVWGATPGSATRTRKCIPVSKTSTGDSKASRR